LKCCSLPCNPTLQKIILDNVVTTFSQYQSSGDFASTCSYTSLTSVANVYNFSEVNSHNYVVAGANLNDVQCIVFTNIFFFIFQIYILYSLYISEPNSVCVLLVCFSTIHIIVVLTDCLSYFYMNVCCTTNDPNDFVDSAMISERNYIVRALYKYSY